MATPRAAGGARPRSGPPRSGRRPRARRAHHRDGLRRAGRRSAARRGRGRVPAADLLVLAQLRLPDDRGHPSRGLDRSGLGRTGHACGSQDHMWGEEIAAGMKPGTSFGEIFGELADGEDLGELREKFAAKAFKRRQEAVLRGLRGAGPADRRNRRPWTCRPTTSRGSEPARRPNRSRATGRCCSSGFAAAGRTIRRSVTSAAGSASRLATRAYLAELRGVRINMEFNGALVPWAEPRPDTRSGCGRGRNRRWSISCWGRVPAAPARPPEAELTSNGVPAHEAPNRDPP